jgi:hypothetical protein
MTDNIGNVLTNYMNNTETLKLYSYDLDRSSDEFLQLDQLNNHGDNLVIWKCIEQLPDKFVELTGIRFADINCYYPLRVKIVQNTIAVDVPNFKATPTSFVQIYNVFQSIVNLRLLTRLQYHQAVRDELRLYPDVYISERDLCMLYLCNFYQYRFHNKTYLSAYNDVTNIMDTSLEERKKALYNLLINNISYHLKSKPTTLNSLVKNMDYNTDFIKILTSIDAALCSYNPHQYPSKDQWYAQVTDQCQYALMMFYIDAYYPNLKHTVLTSFASNKCMFNINNILEYNTNTRLPYNLSQMENFKYFPGDYLTRNNICTSIQDFAIYTHSFINLYSIISEDRSIKFFLDDLLRLTELYGYFNIIIDMHYSKENFPRYDEHKMCIQEQYSYMYPISYSDDIHDNDTSLYCQLYQLLNNSYFTNTPSALKVTPFYQILLSYLIEVSHVPLSMHQLPSIRHIQVTKTVMDDIVITFFSNNYEFIGGYYINEIIETLNTPVIIDANNLDLGLEYLQEYNISVYNK